jgi:RND family efflux transporter MFP subunit
MNDLVRFSILATAALLGACREQEVKAPELRPVRTQVVDPKPVEDDRHAVGEIRPRYESDLSFRVGGKVVERLVDVGASVKKGDVLARLDEQDYRNKLRASEAELSSAEAALVEATGAEERHKTLLTTGATTRARYDETLRNLRGAEANVTSAKANLDLAKDQLAYAELKAEFDGVVTAVGAEHGQVVSSGQMVVRVAQPGDKDAVFSISEAAFKGQPTERPDVAVWLLSDPSVTAEGTVREISPVADPVTRTYTVKVGLKGAPAPFRFGMSVGGRLKIDTAPVIVLPLGAVFDKGGAAAVWVYDPGTSTVALKPVSIVRYEADRVVIGDGLQKGDIAVTAGINTLREGQKVRLAEGASK